MRNLVRSRNFYLMLLLDASLVAGAYYLAFYLRFDGDIPEGFLWLFSRSVAPLVVLKILIFFAFGLYRGMWRFTGLNDLRNVVAASLAATMTMIVYFTLLGRALGFPRSVFVIDFVMTLMFVGGARVAVRLIMNRGSGLPEGLWGGPDRNRKRIMIVGAGNTGEKVVREMMDSPAMKMRPVGFLDDDRGKLGKAIHGVPVKGVTTELGKFQHEFDEVLIAIPSVKGPQMRAIVAACDKVGKRYRIVPNIGEVIGGQISIKTIRDVRYEDLLGREEVSLDSALLNRIYRGKRIMITGAGGSIGSELVRQAAKYQPAALGLVDFSEYNLFQVENDSRRRYEYIPVEAYLVDIRVERAVRRAFAAFKPDVVLHAAAYKHVPLQELNPREAIFNNVKGSRTLVRIAGENGVERFVLVSTDKAVRPTNVMGATKRVAEMFVECMNGGERGAGGCRFMAVRFGNVLGSSGSVIPIFQEQIAKGLPVTVTHPEVTRYFMSTAEAAQLILQAGAMGEGGEIFILDMGEPVKIADMARDLIRLHGLEPDRDIPVRFVGLRPGEKLYEELITEGEGIKPTRHEKIRVIRGRHTDCPTLNAQIDDLIACAETSDHAAIKAKLHEIVPEYTPSK
ncbi:MAG TPA: nucleoside-diphosphate sugar epimerase/dehydratase [Syntrophales bacterium]|nr:nucleoside-diphosphate sugar epimerase/dehydratase [Syntrophales bacterium]